MPVGSNGRMGSSNGSFPLRSGFYGRGHGTVWLPWYLPYGGYWDVPLTWDLPCWDYVNFPPSDNVWEEPAYGQAANPSPPQVIALQNNEPQPPPEPPKLIEVSQSKKPH
jgi:hypothetical protein